MEVAILRKLTWKSRFGFGKHADLTIQQLFDLNLKGYLRWIYFNNSKITYIDEILDMLIYPEYRIDKPGINRELGDQYRIKIEKYAIAKSYESIENNDWTKFGNNKHTTVIRKSKLRDKVKCRNKFSSKSFLQSKNQGH